MQSLKIRAVILGGSGFVGRQVVKALLTMSQFQFITVLSRRPLPELAQLSKAVRVIELKEIEDLKGLDFKGHNCAIMTFGAGKASQVEKEELMKLDALIPIQFAKRCKSDGVEAFELMTSVGADVTSTWSFITRTGAGGGWYSHVKGFCQQEIKKLNFKKLSIIRPAGIVGNPNTGFLNHIAQGLDFFLPNRFNSIRIERLGLAIARQTLKDLNPSVTGVQILEGDDLFALHK